MVHVDANVHLECIFENKQTIQTIQTNNKGPGIKAMIFHWRAKDSLLQTPKQKITQASTTGCWVELWLNMRSPSHAWAKKHYNTMGLVVCAVLRSTSIAIYFLLNPPTNPKLPPKAELTKTYKFLDSLRHATLISLGKPLWPNKLHPSDQHASLEEIPLRRGWYGNTSQEKQYEL